MGIWYHRSESKIIIMGIPGQEKSLTTSYAVWIQRVGQKPGDSKDRAYA